ncbi:MAG: stage II sporulation protein R, partial [Ruminococcus sp.]|nr:stage II sporulation protein R [Ruminococcus sp.]
RKMKKNIILFGGLVLAVIISNIGYFISDGQALDELRGSVLRLHILAESDSEYDQNLKIKVRDRLLESDIFSCAESLDEAEKLAEEKIPEIVDIAEQTLRENGCYVSVTAELVNMDFDERVYGNITMPSGNYRALRIKIGSAKGHNWWCVMYPPLCIPSACEIEENEDAEEVFFTEKEIDIMNKPKKYKVRFAIWDKLKSVFD